MDPISAGIMAGGAGLTGLFGSVLQNQASATAAKDQMNFQSEMSGTAHQREVNDLRAAGLNPMLSALGSGASSPGGAMPTFSNIGEGISKGIDTAIGVRSSMAQIDNQKADTINKQASQSLIENQSAAAAKDVESKALQNSLVKQTMPSIIKKAKAEGDYSEVNQLMGIFGSGVNSAAGIKNLFNPLH